MYPCGVQGIERRCTIRQQHCQRRSGIRIVYIYCWALIASYILMSSSITTLITHAVVAS